jgi:hypothetical protein
MIDADLQNDPEDIPLVVEKLAQGYDNFRSLRVRVHLKARTLVYQTTRMPMFTVTTLLSFEE